MPDSLLDSELQDLMSGTLQRFEKDKFEQCMQALQRYPILKDMFPKAETQTGSKGWYFQIALKGADVAKDTGMFEDDDQVVVPHMETLSGGWVHAQTYWSYDVREIMENKGESLITNVIKPRTANAWISFADLMETNFWTLRTAAQTKKPYGFPYWLTSSATAGFNGSNPTGFTTTAGIDRTDATFGSRFNNYTFAYTTVDKTDFVKKLRAAYVQTQWEAPTDIEDYRKGRGRDMRFYCNYTLLSNIEDIGEAQNENLGKDIASMEGQIVFRRHPIMYVPKLAADATNPLYGIDLNTFKFLVLNGDNLRRGEPIMDAHKHNVRNVFIDHSYTLVCVDPRRNIRAYYTA